MIPSTKPKNKSNHSRTLRICIYNRFRCKKKNVVIVPLEALRAAQENV